MTQFPLPDISLLSSLAQGMRQDRADSAARRTADAGPSSYDIAVANIERRVRGEEAGAARQSQIDQNAQAMRMRQTERSEDRAHAESMLSQQQGFARESQLNELAFKYQKAGLALRQGSGTSPRQAMTTQLRPEAPRTDPTSAARPFISAGPRQIQRHEIPQLFRDPERQQLAQELWDRGEHDQVRIMADKTAGINDIPAERAEIATRMTQRMKVLNAMEEEDALGMVEMTEDRQNRINLLKVMILADGNRDDVLEAQQTLMEDPNAKANITDIRQVPPPELQAVKDAVERMFVDSGRSVPLQTDPEYIHFVINSLRAAGYDIQVVASRGQAVLPPSPPPPDRVQTPAPVDLAGRSAELAESKRRRYEPGDFNRDGFVGTPRNAINPNDVSGAAIMGKIAVEGIAGSYDWLKYQAVEAMGDIDRIGDIVARPRQIAPVKEFWRNRKRDWRYIFGRGDD